MPKTVQFRGGTTTQHSIFTGANREITIDTDKHVPVVHDGVTPGGYPLALASASVKPDGLTTTQAKDAIYAAHNSKSAIEKINGLEASASEIDVIGGLKGKLDTAGISSAEFTDKMVDLSGISSASEIDESIKKDKVIEYDFKNIKTTATGSRYIPNLVDNTKKLSYFSGGGLVMDGSHNIPLESTSTDKEFGIAYIASFSTFANNSIFSTPDGLNDISIISANQIKFKINGIEKTLSLNNALIVNTTYNIIMTRNSVNNLVISIDKVVVAESIMTGQIDFTQVSKSFQGYISNIYTFRRYLTPGDVQKIYITPESFFIDSKTDSSCTNILPLVDIRSIYIRDAVSYVANNPDCFYGNEILTNPTFNVVGTVTTGWTLGSGIVNSGNKLSFKNLTNASKAAQTFPKIMNDCILKLDITVLSGKLDINLNGYTHTASTSNVHYFHLLPDIFTTLSLCANGTSAINDITINSISIMSIKKSISITNYKAYKKTVVSSLPDAIPVPGCSTVVDSNGLVEYTSSSTSNEIFKYINSFEANSLYEVNIESIFGRNIASEYNDVRLNGGYNAFEQPKYIPYGRINYLFKSNIGLTNILVTPGRPLITRKFKDFSISKVDGLIEIQNVKPSNIITKSNYGIQSLLFKKENNGTLLTKSDFINFNKVGEVKTAFIPDSNKDFTLTIVQNMAIDNFLELNGFEGINSEDRFFVGKNENTAKVYVRLGSKTYISSEIVDGADAYIRIKYNGSLKKAFLYINDFNVVELKVPDLLFTGEIFKLGGTGLAINNVNSTVKHFSVYDYISSDSQDVTDKYKILNNVEILSTLNNPVKSTETSSATYVSNEQYKEDREDYKLNLLVAASTSEANAEISRVMGASGIFSTRQYTMDKPFDPTSKVTDVTYSMLALHDHPNYEGTCGSGEYSAIVNGLYVRSRHNDYRLSSTPANATYLQLLPNPTPPIPASISSLPTGVSETGVIDKTSNTQAKAMYNIVTDYKSSCIWEMSYMEVWLEKFESQLDDPFSSFRHTIDANNIEDALKKAIYFNESGHKNRLENIPFMPSIIRSIDEEGNAIYGTIKYRIGSFPVGSGTEIQFDKAQAISGTLSATNSFRLVKDLKTKKSRNYTDWTSLVDSRSAKFSMDSTKINSLIEKIPGFNGAGAVLNETYTSYGLNDTISKIGTTIPLNVAYYHHNYSMLNADASGRNDAHRGFNDPNLYVAKTTQEKVVGGYTYLIPLEMILRTPLETWNPHQIPNVSYATLAASKTGSTIDKPMAGWNEVVYNNKIPFALFGDAAKSDAADTGLDNNFVREIGGNSVKVSGSGIKSFNFKGERIRVPIAPNYHEFSKAWSDLEVFKMYVKDILKGIANGTTTSADIDNIL